MPHRYPHDVQAHLQLWPYYCGVAAACTLSSVLTARVDLDSPDSCMAAFKAHKVCMMGLPCHQISACGGPMAMPGCLCLPYLTA